MRRRFFWSILGIATLALVLVGLFAAVIGQVALTRETEREMSQESVAIERLLESQLTDETGTKITVARLAAALRAGQLSDTVKSRVGSLLSMVEGITGGRQVDIGWVDVGGSLRMLENPALSSALRFDVDLLDSGKDSVVRRRVPGEAGVVLAVAHPLGSTRLVIVLRQRLQVISGQGYFRIMLIAFLIAVLLAAVAARLLSGRLASRGAKLADAARRIAGGDVTARAGLEGTDEVAEIASAFDEMADRLEATQTSEREFLLSVGHDLRTPLTTIGGYAEALEEGGLDEASLARVGGVVSNETRRLRRLIEDLIMLARLDGNEFTLRPEDVDVGAHLWGVAEAFHSRAEADGLRFSVRSEETGTMQVDPDRLAQIAGNLIENALRYTPEAGMVEFRVSPTGGGVVLEVADSGPGIEPEDLPHVFERFFVSHRYRGERPEGSGLGLSIVHRLVTAMGGTVDVTSDAGGTTFRVELPR
ncbi:MAG: HAMP domain-containing sensor histidine kinase [Acidimicrobiia bacterium]